MDILKAIVGFIVIVFVIIFGVSLFGQNIEKNTWGNFEYVVRADDRYYYTHKVTATKDNRCIGFIDNYNKSVELCEKYQVEENYWFNNSPSARTVIWSP
jgi:uncharacterized protein YxeA